MYVIKEVNTKKDINRFINFPMELYKDSPYYVPMLIGDEKKIFKEDYVYNNICDTIFFLCVDENDKVVGRIEGIIQKSSNEKWNQKRVRFTRFDCINDQEVANLLFDAVASWAKKHDLDEMVGPLGYSDLEREGLLIDGFDKLQTYEEQYNYEYYQHLIDNYGFEKDVDWLEYKLFPPKVMDERIENLSKKIMERRGFTLCKPTNLSKFIKEYKDAFFDIIDVTYSKLYGTVPFTKEMIESSLSNFRLILRPQDLVLVLNKEKKVIGFALIFPSISKIVTKYKGKINLRFLIDFLKNKKKPEVLDLGLIGALPEFAMQGVATVLMYAFYQLLLQEPIEHIETNLMLEHNDNILKFTANLEREYTKRRRCYKKKI